jgi:hypothetical protein
MDRNQKMDSLLTETKTQLDQVKTTAADNPLLPIVEKLVELVDYLAGKVSFVQSY